jgi:predicted dehydrogenase
MARVDASLSGDRTMRCSRREFLSAALISAATVAKSRRVLGANDRLGVAVIGLNGMGHFHLQTLVARADLRVVTLCDVDDGVLARGAKTVKDSGAMSPELVKDFRRVLDDRSIDAVVIATPHHWHAPIAVRAMQAGKDVYVEKPASHVFREGRLLVDAARKHKRIVQQGTQMRSSEITAKAAEVLASGVLGTIKMTKAWNIQRHRHRAAVPDAPVPRGVDYDMWLGPASKRPFNPNRFHGNWQWYREYGNGDIGNDGIHDIDMARFGLGVTTHPVRITAHGSRIDLVGEREYPDNMMVAFHYAEGKVLLYEDRGWSPYPMYGVDSGNAFYGTEGWMLFSRRGFFQVFLGAKEEKGPSMGQPGRVGQPAPAHMANFLDCVRTRRQPAADPETAHLSCALVHLGEISHRVSRVLNFDPATEQIVNDAEAQAMLTKEYRAPWLFE